MKCGGRNHFAKVCHTKPHTEGQRKSKPKYNQKPTNWRSSNQNTRGKQIHEVTDDARETFFIDTVKKKTSEPWRILLSITHLVDDKKTCRFQNRYWRRCKHNKQANLVITGETTTVGRKY
ncbi:hypothetical protein PoB_001681500 [Plakobranchus ocellatus]|uniref:Uncharacterized protein n=1 Tax=Plakobranchus ocellatus TaxID=259542 RepID=A0AAV3Z6X6_9GAST|nr:hypothetical protein PoB_001681500 [Plakobranchus ocellatus]